ncbi:permease prefix domain 1-containing protein [Lentibacillus salinarum]|uniref:Permease prefix domain 1-containing protein n=1 Tax=Lentibacillus salinarum TaxID=446820 RepID=A0ABW3ZRS0_9BACI
MTKIEKQVEKILEQMQSPDGEREEIRSELLGHLEEAKRQYIGEGLTEKRAEERAMAEFGAPSMIGHQLQESMYPFQRGLLYVIGIGTILFGVIFYLNLTFFLNEPTPVWLAVQLLSGSAVTLAAINISFVGRYFYVLNLVLLVNVIWNGISFTLAWGMSAWQAIFFGIYLVILIAFGAIAVIRNSYYSSDQTEGKQQKRGLVLFSYVVNLLFGVAVAGVSLFFLWGLLAFSEARIEFLLTLAPIIIWLITYKFQMTFIAKKPVVSLVTGLGFSVMSFLLPYIMLLLFMGRF